MSNNDSNTIERVATIIQSPPVSLNISGNQLNRLRKDKSQYETYIRDLNLYKSELEDSVKNIDSIIGTTFNKLKEELTKIIYGIIKNLKEAENVVNSIIKSPEIIINTDINTLIMELLKKIELYFGLDEKYRYIQQQIRTIENSIQYQNELEAVRRQRLHELEFPSSTYYVRPGMTGQYRNNNNNNSNHPNNNTINDVFLPTAPPQSRKKPTNKSAIVGSVSRSFKISPSNEDILIDLGSQSKGGGTYYENEGNEDNEMESAYSNDENKTTNKSRPLPPRRNERINLQPSYIPQVVNSLKKYILSESRNKNVNTNKLAKLQFIESPSQLLAHLKIYNNIIIQQHSKLQEKLKQQSVRILEELQQAVAKLKMAFYIKEQAPLKINEINEHIENLGGPFTNKNLYINKKPKAIPNIKPQSNFNKTLRKRGWNTTSSREKRDMNTRPWYKKIFTKKQSQSQPLTDVELPTTIRWKNRIESAPLNSTVEYRADEPVTSLRKSTNVAESVGPETVAVNWAVQSAPTSWWGRMFRRSPTTVRETIGTAPPATTRKWYKFWGGSKRKTQKRST